MQQAVVVQEIADIFSHRALIEKAIAHYGASVENHFMHWVYHSRKDRPNVFFHFGNNRGIMARCHIRSKNWYMIGYPLGPREEWVGMMHRFIEHVFTAKHATKLYIEVEPDFRKEICESLGSTPYKDSRINTTLVWPLFKMEQWDEQLAGGDYKKLRNLKNGMERLGATVVDSRHIPAQQLLAIVKTWVKNRGAHDSVDAHYYEHMIKNNFAGMDVCRSVVIEGIARTITCGWFSPGRKAYYSAVGISDYSVEGVGEYANLDDLLYLKQRGFSTVDFGGSDSVLLDFKKKFRFHDTYKTHLFSIVKRPTPREL